MLSALLDVTPVINNSIFSRPPAVKPIRTSQNIFPVNKTKTTVSQRYDRSGSSSTIVKSHIHATDNHCCWYHQQSRTDLWLASPHYLECRILSFHHYHLSQIWQIADPPAEGSRSKLTRLSTSSALNIISLRCKLYIHSNVEKIQDGNIFRSS